MSHKVAIIQSHPIQHFCPQFASYAQLPGIEIHVVFESFKGVLPYFDTEFAKEVRWTGIDLNAFPHTFIKDKSIEFILDQFDPRFVMVYGYSSRIQIRAYKWAVKRRRKILYVSDTTSHARQSFLRVQLRRWRYWRYFQGIDACMSVGDSNEVFYRSLGISNARLIRTFFPIDIKHMSSKLRQKNEISKSIRVKYGISPNAFILTTIGKLLSSKRQGDLLMLLKKLDARGIEVVAFIIGSGPAESKLREMSQSLKSNQAILTGFVEPELLPDFLCATDVYVHPSEKEAHSLSISEAIYMGCPVLISDACGSYGPTDDVQPGRNGFVYPVGDVNLLAKWVELLHGNKKTWSRFSETSRRIGQHNQRLAHGESLVAATTMLEYQAE